MLYILFPLSQALPGAMSAFAEKALHVGYLLGPAGPRRSRPAPGGI